MSSESGMRPSNVVSWYVIILAHHAMARCMHPPSALEVYAAHDVLEGDSCSRSVLPSCPVPVSSPVVTPLPVLMSLHFLMPSPFFACASLGACLSSSLDASSYSGRTGSPPDRCSPVIHGCVCWIRPGWPDREAVGRNQEQEGVCCCREQKEGGREEVRGEPS